jgi:hypothetical protein
VVRLFSRPLGSASRTSGAAATCLPHFSPVRDPIHPSYRRSRRASRWVQRPYLGFVCLSIKGVE